MLPKIQSVAFVSGSLEGIGADTSTPSLHNVLARRHNGEDPLSSSQLLPVVSRKQRNQYDRFRFFKSKDQTPIIDVPAKKG